MRSLSVIIPAYNESENIQWAVAEALSALPPLVADYEIIVVDDGSVDSTADAVLENFRNAGVHVVRHSVNSGKGSALRTGFQRARMDWILFVDADRQIHPTELASFLPHTERADIVIGYRMNRPEAFSRRFFSRCYSLLISVLLGINVKDINCPFKLMKKSIPDTLTLTANGFFIDAELMYQVRKKGYTVVEVGVKSHPRTKGSSTISFRHVTETLKELLKLFAH
jgi:glycosyltransferase involved in cell wall biosynthesis